MTPTEFFAKWTTEAEAMQRRGVMVNGAGLLAEALADFKAVQASQVEAVLPLPEAASRSGYSVEHLGRLIREGRVPNAGRRGRLAGPAGGYRGEGARGDAWEPPERHGATS